jgi:hypothetical protein
MYIKTEWSKEKEQKEKEQTTIYKTLHIKLNTEQHEPPLKIRF